MDGRKPMLYFHSNRIMESIRFLWMNEFINYSSRKVDEKPAKANKNLI
ncbi:hypothetical protein HMPREF0973_02443 [Prevotella veroralis F0319]|uniref:Uncharacterized protein n=1 Tax=Prevotella veroralis F0319 TaxID=649761 RepID=C9MS30_9BACT|nr:hypothetical protein HMPREF0973_02443 [Prevotella veroralis F0319]